MEKIELIGIDQDVYYEKLDIGLKVFLLPFPNKKNYYASYITKYGSIDTEFIPINEKQVISTNPGIAHFLEHKMFEQEDGTDPFQFFSKSGTGCNASTTYKKTMYFINGVNDLEKNLEYLIDYVNSPYFTDENVEKEKGIIVEEINMYKDNPDFIISDEIQKSTYNIHPIRVDVAGSIDTVNKITKEEIYKCYNTFYQPGNMFLVIGGNFDPSKIIDLIKSNKKLMSRGAYQLIERKKYDEALEVNKSYKEIIHSNVSVPKISMNIKLSIKDITDKYKYYLYISAILKILFDSSSEFREEMYKKKYASSLYYGKMILGDLLILEFYAESDKPKELIDQILVQFKTRRITEKELERFIKVQIAAEVMGTDNLELTVDNVISDLITWDKVIDNAIDLLRNLNINELNEIQNNLMIDNNAVVVLKDK